MIWLRRGSLAIIRFIADTPLCARVTSILGFEARAGAAHFHSEAFSSHDLPPLDTLAIQREDLRHASLSREIFAAAIKIEHTAILRLARQFTRTYREKLVALMPSLRVVRPAIQRGLQQNAHRRLKMMICFISLRTMSPALTYRCSRLGFCDIDCGAETFASMRETGFAS